MKPLKLAPEKSKSHLEIDNKPNFEQQINRICEDPPNQLNALIKLKRFFNSQERKVLVNSFAVSNFNNCTLVCLSKSLFTYSKSLTKIKNLHKRALRFMLDDYLSS